MPRYGFDKRFRLGRYFLGKQSRSPAWCRCYYDPVTRQTKRHSLGTTDFEEAKLRLHDWYLLNHRPGENPHAPPITVAACLARYWEHHAKKQTSAARTKINIEHWLDFFGDRPVTDLLDQSLQLQFHQKLLDGGLKPSSVQRIVTSGAAAVNFAHKRGDLHAAPHIARVAKPKGQPSAPPMGRPLELDEITRLFEVTDNESLRLFIAFALATGARPDAILDLSLDKIDLNDRLINLLPDGREQTTKHRPIVKLPSTLVPLVKRMKAQQGKQFVIGDGNAPQKSIRRAWRNARAAAKLDDRVQPYSLRHTVARWLRQQGVDAWQVSAQLGHKRSELSITEVYAPHDPSWLVESCAAIDALFDQLRVKSVGMDELLGAKSLK